MSWRYRLSLFLFVLFFIGILIRLFQWQIVRGAELTRLGEAQYGQNIKLIPLRGEIETSDGFPIAANKISYLVFANPKEIKDKEKISTFLASALGEETATISGFLSLNRFWVALKSNVDSNTKEEIEKQKLPGIGFEDQSIRFYPEASVAAKLLGFVGKDENGENSGYFGLEGYYDRQLRGRSGIAKQIHDAFGRPILARMNNLSGEIDGRNLILYVDRTIQFILEKELKQGIEKYGALGGMAAVMDPKTGGILAMSGFPAFDPRDYARFTNEEYKNPLISSSYEPGSTFKPFVLSAALEEGLVTPNTKCTTCNGPVEIGGYTIRTWNDKYFPSSTMLEVIQHSDNTGMVFVSQKLGLVRMMKYFDKFGITKLTGVDLQGEMTPTVKSQDSWYPIDVATASFGQGVSVTPIGLLSAFSSIANYGKRMEPHVVHYIETENGEKVEIKPKLLNQPISAKTAKIMTEILVNAVDKGEAKWARPKGYRIAGKTGTAQIPIEGKYDANKTIPSFIGFAPADDPKFIMLVILDRPTTSIYGAETAAPLFFNIAKQILAYYNIPPTEPVE